MSSKRPVIAVYDKKLGLFDPPFVVRHIGEAVREWDVVTKDEKTKFGKHPSDFELFHIADYDDSLGNFIPVQPHYQLASGVENGSHV